MKLLFAGDVFITKPDNFTLETGLQEFIVSHDIICCNFEAPIKTNANPIEKRGPALFQSPDTPKKLEKYGFNLISLANNHIMDYGVSGLESTINAFKSLDIPILGAGFSDEDIYSPQYIKTKKQTIAILSLCQAEFGVKKRNKGRAGYAWMNEPILRKKIPDIKKTADVLVILCHAGLENEKYPLPELQDMYRSFIDMGADYIIGNHPHVIQGYEEYKQKFICYSLGNFIFDTLFPSTDEYIRSLIVSIDTETEKYQLLPVKCIENIITFDMSSMTRQDLKERSDFILKRECLEKWADTTAEKLWNESYKFYYKLYNTVTLKDASVVILLKAIIKKILRIHNFSSDFDETMLLHNIQIEPHRWIVERYLYNQNIERNGL